MLPRRASIVLSLLTSLTLGACLVEAEDEWAEDDELVELVERKVALDGGGAIDDPVPFDEPECVGPGCDEITKKKKLYVSEDPCGEPVPQVGDTCPAPNAECHDDLDGDDSGTLCVIYTCKGTSSGDPVQACVGDYNALDECLAPEMSCADIGT